MKSASNSKATQCVRGRRVITRLKIATVYNKIILIAIIGVELLIIGCIVYFKWIRK